MKDAAKKYPAGKVTKYGPVVFLPQTKTIVVEIDADDKVTRQGRPIEELTQAELIGVIRELIDVLRDNYLVRDRQWWASA